MSPQRAALAEGWPVLVSVVLVAIPFGIVARQSGLTPAEIMAMSVFVFAGAAQFAMVRLFVAGTVWPIVVATVFLINLRHLLMAAAFVLTDEAFAMAIGWFRRGRRELRYYASFAVALYVLWVAATAIGVLVGPSIGEPRRFGIDFAITATFIAIVALGVRRRSDAVVALVAALAAAALTSLGASVVAVVTAGAVAPLLVLLARDEPAA